MHHCSSSIWEQRQANPRTFTYETQAQTHNHPASPLSIRCHLAVQILYDMAWAEEAKVERGNCEGLCDVPEKGKPCVDLIPGSHVGWGSRWAGGYGFTSPSSFVDQKKQLTSQLQRWTKLRVSFLRFYLCFQPSKFCMERSRAHLNEEDTLDVLTWIIQGHSGEATDVPIGGGACLVSLDECLFCCFEKLMPWNI